MVKMSDSLNVFVLLEADLKYEYRSLETVLFYRFLFLSFLILFCFNNIVTKKFIGRTVVLAVLVF